MSASQSNLKDNSDQSNPCDASNATVQIIDAPELARRWQLPVSWIRERTRRRTADGIPCLRFGRYVRFRWGSPELEDWLAQHCDNGGRGQRQ